MRSTRLLSLFAPACLAVALGVALPSFAEEGTATAVPTAAIGGQVTAFKLTDTAGAPFDLDKCAVTGATAEAAVRKAAAGYGAAADAAWTTTLDSLPGVKDEDDEVDADKRLALIHAASSSVGLLANEDRADTITTLGDLRDFVQSANGQPFLFIVWSPKCPTSKKLNDRIQEAAADLGVRTFAVLGNTGDTAAHVDRFRENYGFPIRVLVDADHVAVDILGGQQTPHLMLVDKTKVLRYRGALDNDLHDALEGAERQDYLRDAVAAVRKGGAIENAETKPFG